MPAAVFPVSSLLSMVADIVKDSTSSEKENKQNQIAQQNDAQVLD